MTKQQLTLTKAWCVTYDEFFKIDPEPMSENSSNWWYFKEDLLQIENKSAGLLIDLGWYPEFNVEGQFKLMLVRFSENPEDMINNWDNPLKIFNSKNRVVIVREIEKWVTIEWSI